MKERERREGQRERERERERESLVAGSPSPHTFPPSLSPSSVLPPRSALLVPLPLSLSPSPYLLFSSLSLSLSLKVAVERGTQQARGGELRDGNNSVCSAPEPVKTTVEFEGKGRRGTGEREREVGGSTERNRVERKDMDGGGENGSRLLILPSS